MDASKLWLKAVLRFGFRSGPDERQFHMGSRVWLTTGMDVGGDDQVASARLRYTAEAQLQGGGQRGGMTLLAIMACDRVLCLPAQLLTYDSEPGSPLAAGTRTSYAM